MVVDKPAGPTSFDVVRAVRRAYCVRKAGHTGTLDPFATGVLAVCVGRATRLVPWLQAGEKEYVATVRLGVETDTLDPEGAVVREVPAADPGRAAVESALACFVGRIRQVPPAFSAIKLGGRRAYDLARRGERPELSPRDVEVYALELQALEPPRLVVRVRCGPGFYVRALARDLGQALGLPAYLEALRRTRTGGFVESDCLSLPALGERAPVPMAEALRSLPAVDLWDEAAQAVSDGRVPAGLAPPEGLAEGGACRLLDPGGALLAMAERRGAALRLVRVLAGG